MPTPVTTSKSGEPAAFRRKRYIRSSPPAPRLKFDTGSYLSFSSNDYLGLAYCQPIREALVAATLEHGVGSGASPMMSGYCSQHAALEQELAAALQTDKALLFSNGYMANLGVLTALVEPGDTLLVDAKNHASLIDAARLTGAYLRRYQHTDLESLETGLKGRLRGRTFVATDAVFSMDGDVAPLNDIAAVCRRYGANLIVDDAHGFGVLGTAGRGTVTHFGLGQTDVLAYIATFGKALGTYGAFVAGSQEVVDRLVQRSRTYIYSTALPPALVAATRTALRVALEDQWRRERLFQLIVHFREHVRALGLPGSGSTMPIQPYFIGSEDRAIRYAAELATEGVHVVPIRSPTVPRGTARLRISLTAMHSRTHVDQLVSKLTKIHSRLYSDD